MISRLSEVRIENYEDVQSLVEEKPQVKISEKGIVLGKDRKWYQGKGPAETLSEEKQWQPRKVGRCGEFEGFCESGQQLCFTSDRGKNGLRGTRNVVDVVAKSNKEIKEKLCAAVVHLQLHGAAALEGAAAADDEGEIVCAQLGVGVGCVGVCVSGRCKNGASLDARLWMEVSIAVKSGQAMLL